MSWYLASVLLSAPAKSDVMLAQLCHCLIQVEDHEKAYDQSLTLGKRLETGTHHFLGVEDLLLVHEEPADGSELIWTESEMSRAELENQVHEKNIMQAFLVASETGWYLASVVLCEIHDEGTHGDDLLVWVNSYLIKARDPEHAYARALEVGRAQQEISGSHMCGGDRAHWVLTGVRDIIPLREPPAADALLWCDQLNVAPEDLLAMLPDKPGLGVFRWEAERAHRPSR